MASNIDSKTCQVSSWAFSGPSISRKSETWSNPNRFRAPGTWSTTNKERPRSPGLTGWRKIYFNLPSLEINTSWLKIGRATKGNDSSSSRINLKGREMLVWGRVTEGNIHVFFSAQWEGKWLVVKRMLTKLLVWNCQSESAQRKCLMSGPGHRQRMWHCDCRKGTLVRHSHDGTLCLRCTSCLC